MQPNLTLSAGCYVAGYLTGLLAFLWIARRRRLATSGIAVIATTGLLGGLFAANISQWLVTGGPGKTVLGAVIGGWLSVIIAKRVMGIRRPTGDLFAVALCAGEAVGRWGCFFGGCCYGKHADLPWAVWQHEAFRHPTQLYLSFASLIILLVLLWWERHSPPENALFALQGLLYCLARFGIEFYREGPVAMYGLTTAQFVCGIGLLIFGWKLSRLPYGGSV